MSAREALFARIGAELDRAYAKHGRDPWGRHEFYGVLKEEVDELWDAIKADAPIDSVVDELVQVAAMCVRYYETGDRYRGPHHVEDPCDLTLGGLRRCRQVFSGGFRCLFEADHGGRLHAPSLFTLEAEHAAHAVAT